MLKAKEVLVWGSCSKESASRYKNTTAINLNSRKCKNSDHTKFHEEE